MEESIKKNEEAGFWKNNLSGHFTMQPPLANWRNKEKRDGEPPSLFLSNTVKKS